MNIIQSRLDKLSEFTLEHGSHSWSSDDDVGKGMCALECAAYLAGEVHSASPSCVCPVITSVIVGWNDSLPDDDTRNRLIRDSGLLVKMLGTRIESDSVLLKRMYMIQDWNIRVRMPAFLRLAGFIKEADDAMSLAEIVDNDSLIACESTCSAARLTANSAADSAADSAARSAVDSAVDSAARSAVDSAVDSAIDSAAWSDAWSDAWSAAWSAADSAANSAANSAARLTADSAARLTADSAALSAAYSAAWSALSATVSDLQESFVALMIRVCEVTES